jgi:hypothetical protein
MGSGLHESSEAIRERVGLDAQYAPLGLRICETPHALAAKHWVACFGAPR